MSKWKVRLENTIFFHPDEDDVRYGPRWCITLTTGEDLDLGPHSHIRRWESNWEEL